MNEATVSTKGWVVIPKVYRQKYNLRPGARVQIVDYGGGLSIVPLSDDPIESLHGLLAGGPSLTGDLLAERQKEKEKEDGRLA
jgi:AbrB family looped-hinge helix DNA binding protein